jgi:hypothetical protein
MSQHLANSTCLLIPGINGGLQVVHSQSGQIVIDVQSVHFDVAGQVRHDHSTIRLTYDAVSELRAVLDLIAEPMEPRQPALWSDATFSRPVHARQQQAEGYGMSAAVHRLYTVQEANADPFAIPSAPLGFVRSSRDRGAMRMPPASAGPRCGCGAARERQPVRLSHERDPGPSLVPEPAETVKGEVKIDNLPSRSRIGNLSV